MSLRTGSNEAAISPLATFSVLGLTLDVDEFIRFRGDDGVAGISSVSLPVSS